MAYSAEDVAGMLDSSFSGLDSSDDDLRFVFDEEESPHICGQGNSHA